MSASLCSQRLDPVSTIPGEVQTTLGRRFTEGLIGMTGGALFIVRLFRMVLRISGDRRVLGRARGSEHAVVGDVPITVAESRVWGSEPGRAVWAAFNRSWL